MGDRWRITTELCDKEVCVMPEQLLTPTNVKDKLKISRSKFYRIRGRLIANGMQTVKIDGSVKYLESSIDELIQRCAREGRPLC